MRRTAVALALPAVVGVSSLLHWLVGRRIDGLWIMPDEAIYAERGLAFWHHGPLPLLHGQGAGYGVLYPIMAGLPISTGSFERGYMSLKLLQALVVSLAAVPVFAYGRRLMPPGYALLAAVLTVASPLLLYSGLVMSEVLFYPIAALTLLAAVRAVETSSPRDQVISLVFILAAVLTREQAVVFAAVLAAAVVVDAALARDRSRLRRFWPTWLALVATAVVAGAAPGLFGAYSGTLRGSYPLGPALGLMFDHLSFLALSTGIVSIAALVLLLVEAIAGRERDPRARALIAVTGCGVVMIVVQVGFFASRYAPHLLGRDLAALPPLLFLVLALWIARGVPRARLATTLSVLCVLGVLLFAPWNHLVAAPDALPDTLDLAIFGRLHTYAPSDVVRVVSVITLTLFVLIPRRLVLGLAAFVLAMLVWTSVVASSVIEARVETAQANLVGSRANWIDHAVASANVAYLYDGETYWNGVWQERFWNRRLDRVVSIYPYRVPGPISQTIVTLPSNGHLPIRERYVVATDLHTFFGTPVAHLAQTGLDVSGLTLWRLDGPPRLSTSTHGVQPNGDMVTPATINIYDCEGGRLELTLLPKATRVLRILLDGNLALQQSIGGQPFWRGAVPAPLSSRPRRCAFTILGQSLLGSTRIEFVRP